MINSAIVGHKLVNCPFDCYKLYLYITFEYQYLSIMRILYFILLLLFGIEISAQNEVIEKIDIQEGLSNRFIMGITQDKTGFIWISTESGLNRFDGNVFRTYKTDRTQKNTNTISGNELNKIYADKHDNIIWIATQREGLNAFDCKTETFTHFKHNPEDPHSIITNDITCITNSKDGNLWISTYYQGFEYYDKITGRFTHYNMSNLPQLPSNHIWELTESKDGLLYIAQVDAGLTIYSPKTNTLKNYQKKEGDDSSLPSNNVNAVFIDSNNNVWVGTASGLALFNQQKETFTRFINVPNNNNSLISNAIQTITQMADGKLWIGCENGGISILDLQQSLFTGTSDVQFINITYGDDENSLSNKTVKSIFQDSFDNIWIGTYGGGLNFISSQKPFFNSWSYSPIPTAQNRLDNKVAWGICADSKDNLWIGTDGGGINIFSKNKKVKTFNKFNSSLTDDAVIAAFCDSKDNIWIGTFKGGAYVYSSKEKELKPINIDYQTDIRCFDEDADGIIWIGTSNGIYTYNYSSNSITNYNKTNSELRDNLVRSIHHDKNNNLWIGFFGDGVARYNAQMELIDYIDKEYGLPSNLINQIISDKQGRIWLATGYGLVYLKQEDDYKNPFSIETENDIADNHIRAIAQDERGNIWVSTTSGISSYDTVANSFKNYDTHDGIPIGAFMSGSVTKTSDNTIYFGSQSGVCFFNINQLQEPTTNPRVIISDINIYESGSKKGINEFRIPSKPEINLKYNQNTIDITYSILNYAQANTIEYSYMIRGMSNDWYFNKNSNKIILRDLAHGTYELLIRSKTKNLDWTDNPASLKIVINPPLWLTWWAKMIYTIIVGAILATLTIFYKRKLVLENSLILEKNRYVQEHATNEERLRFFANITHELRTPLTLIISPLEEMSYNTSLSRAITSKISLVLKSANNLLNLTNQLLEFGKTETQKRELYITKGDLRSLIIDIGSKYVALNIKHDVLFNVAIADGDYEFYFDEQAITTIVENLISNALKHTHKGSITLSLRNKKINDTLYTEIAVKDTGVGIKSSSLSKIFDRYYQEEGSSNISGTGIGLALVKNLANLHQAEILVDSEVNKGSTFTLRLNNSNFYVETPTSEAIVKDNKTTVPDNEEQTIVLVIEDNKEINDYIKEVLSENYLVHSAYNGDTGLEMALKIIPDIIISDIMMPGLNGLALTKTLKENILTSHIPIILLTAKDTINDRTEGYKLGADSYITKPFTAGLLQSRIENILKTRKLLTDKLSTGNINKSDIVMESMNKIDQEFIDKIKETIEQNIESDTLDINYIAGKMMMSHSTLYRKTKALTGMTTNEFIRKVRIYKAEELLLTGKYTVSEIMYLVGMNSPTYFRQCFKDEFKLTPTEYIKNLTNNKNQKT